MRYTMADGTIVEEDAAGNVTYIDGAGRTYGADTSILGSFVTSITGSLAQAVQTALNPPASPVVGTNAAGAPGAFAGFPGGIVGVALAAFLAYKLLA